MSLWWGSVLNQQTETGQDVIFALKQALIHEEVNGAFELGALEVNFYEVARSKMNGLVGGELIEATKALRKLMSKRVAKIIRMASLNPLSQLIEVKLTQDEKELYTAVFNSCIMFKNIVTKGEQNVKE